MSRSGFNFRGRRLDLALAFRKARTAKEAARVLGVETGSVFGLIQRMAAEGIIDEEVRAFVAATHHRASGPVIARFREGLESVQAAELVRLYGKVPELDDRARREIEQFADRLVAKMLHPPLESLRDESRNGSVHGLLDALQRLFQLKEKDD